MVHRHRRPGPDLMNIVDDALLSARANPGSAGQLRLLAGNQPVYLCPLRDDASSCWRCSRSCAGRATRRTSKPHDFSFAHSLLAPALECLRRELMAHATIEDLNHDRRRARQGPRAAAHAGRERAAQPRADGAERTAAAPAADHRAPARAHRCAAGAGEERHAGARRRRRHARHAVPHARAPPAAVAGAGRSASR